uniref:Uncharacterized protein n=1 Tax=Gopherus evgoodei TaxID=1825980 RepID=A0A8C4VGH8_9SAUR
MAVPPSYCDLGKSARDVFNKGYGKDATKCNLNSEKCSSVLSLL